MPNATHDRTKQNQSYNSLGTHVEIIIHVNLTAPHQEEALHSN